MAEIERVRSEMMEMSNAMVRLHKEQFGRGPTKARSDFAGPNAVLCVLEDALLPAEQKLIALNDENRVRDGRISFQVATEPEFIASAEKILLRKVRSFASAVDVKTAMVFEVFVLEPQEGDGAVPPLSDWPSEQPALDGRKS